jgi:glutamine amidotransferase
MKREVVLVDSGGSNIGSLRYALERLGVQSAVSADAARLRAATHVILPGVGAAGPGMRKLREAGLIGVMRELRQPVLGVCLGMQLLFARSEEGDTACLDVIPGSVRRMPETPQIRVPHMGWNRLGLTRTDPLLDGIADGEHAYFVHGYAAPVGAATLARCDHGGEFSAVVRQGNFLGAQFHPERSGAVGARLLRNFLEL